MRDYRPILTLLLVLAFLNFTFPIQAFAESCPDTDRFRFVAPEMWHCVSTNAESNDVGMELTMATPEAVPARIIVAFRSCPQPPCADTETIASALGAHKVGKMVVCGKEADVFERMDDEFVAPTDPAPDNPEGDPRVYESAERMAVRVMVRERIVLLPAQDGFYSLSYSAPEQRFDEFLNDFARVLTTFTATP